MSDAEFRCRSTPTPPSARHRATILRRDHPCISGGETHEASPAWRTSPSRGGRTSHLKARFEFTRRGRGRQNRSSAWHGHRHHECPVRDRGLHPDRGRDRLRRRAGHCRGHPAVRAMGWHSPRSRMYAGVSSSSRPLWCGAYTPPGPSQLASASLAPCGRGRSGRWSPPRWPLLPGARRCPALRWASSPGSCPLSPAWSRWSSPSSSASSRRLLPRAVRSPTADRDPHGQTRPFPTPTSVP